MQKDGVVAINCHLFVYNSNLYNSNLSVVMHVFQSAL